MSGHSKWATTKRAKAVTDAKRASAFTRVAKIVTIAAREGGDPTMNFKLRLAIEKAREVNMPKDNIERAIKRGTGEIAGAIIEEITYEGFGPSGSAFMVEVMTDNRNRAASEIKRLFTNSGGNLGASGSVAWMFDRVGGIKAEKPENKSQDELELLIIDAGAEDLEWLDHKTAWVYTKPQETQKVKEALEKSGFKILDSEIGYKAKETLPVADDLRPTLERLYDALDDSEDVQNFWSNMAV